MTCLLESSHLRHGAAPESPGSLGHAWAVSTASCPPRSRILSVSFTNRWKARQGFWIPDSFLPVQGKYHLLPSMATLRGKAICLQQHSSSTATADGRHDIVQRSHVLPSTLAPCLSSTCLLPLHLTSGRNSKNLTCSSSRPVD